MTWNKVTRKNNNFLFQVKKVQNAWTFFFFWSKLEKERREFEVRILGLDVGTVRIGVAQSDPMGIIASATEVIVRTTPERDAARVAELAKKLDAKKIVVGLPLQMNGQEGLSVKMVKDFVAVLEAIVDIPIEFQDERLSTVSAQRVLIESDMRRQKRKGVVDKIAATIILQNHLDKQKR